MKLARTAARRSSRVVTAGAAVAGAVLGHAITYLLTVPDGGQRAAVIAAAGHGYWSSEVAMAAVLGTLALVVTISRHLRVGLGRSRPPSLEGPAHLLQLLASIQVTLYVCQELAERLVAHAPLFGLATDRVLVIGILVQAAVAAFASVLLVVIGRSAELVGRRLSRRRRRQPRPTPRRGTALDRAGPSRLLVASGTIRAPPAG